MGDHQIETCGMCACDPGTCGEYVITQKISKSAKHAIYLFLQKAWKAVRALNVKLEMWHYACEFIGTLYAVCCER